MNQKTRLTLQFLTLLLLSVAFAFSANAQSKRKKTTVAAKAPVVVASLEIKDSAEKVSIQIKNVSKFVYLLGGVARAIEDVDKEARTRKLSSGVLEQNAKNKEAVNQSVRNLRAGLVALEIEFRTKPTLKSYLFKIQGVSDLAAEADNLASAGQFTEAGKSLLLVIEKLSDTLVALP